MVFAHSLGVVNVPRMLIVDSDRIFLLLVSLHFRRRGWTVITASDGYEALERLEPTLDAVTLDIDIRGVSAEELLRFAGERNDLRRVCFIVLAAHLCLPRLLECLRLGASDYVEKSILPRRLEQVLIECVARVQFLAKQPGETVRAFLSYARADLVIVRDLCERLRRDQIEPSLDLAPRIAGPKWDLEILRALKGCDAVLFCLSSNSVNQNGSLQKELERVLDLMNHQRAGTMFIVLAKVNSCEVPQRLRRWHSIDLTVPDGYARLLAALHGAR
jgi:CheY-like chemotaxis protein